MPCNSVYPDNPRVINLFTSLPNAQTGGTWTLDAPVFPFTLSKSTNGTAFSNQVLTSTSTVISGGHQIWVDLNNICPGIYKFKYTIAAGGSCPASEAIYTITVNDEPCVDIQISPASICQICGSASNLPITIPTTVRSSCAGGTTPLRSYQWSKSIDGGITFVNIPGATFSTLTVSMMPVNTIFRVTCCSISNPSCCTYDEIAYALGTPICSGIATDQEFCVSLPLTIDLRDYVTGIVGTANWTLHSGVSGNVTGTLPIAVISATGMYVFRNTVESGTCSTITDLMIKVSLSPNAGTGSTTTICNS